MTQRVEEALHSDAPIVAIEAAAGCGKTWTAAKFACETSAQMEQGRVLLLSHTHAACGEFQKRCVGAGLKVDVETCDSFALKVVGSYAPALGLPYPLGSRLGRVKDGVSYTVLSEKAVDLFCRAPTIAKAVAANYPTIVLDEHQDSSRAQHQMIMLLKKFGQSRVRAFADPMQAIHPDSDDGYVDWPEFWEAADTRDTLSTPHRWPKAKELGDWINAARSTLRAGNPISLADAPRAVQIQRHAGLAGRHRFKDVKAASGALHGLLNQAKGSGVALAFLAPMVRSLAQTGGWRAGINEGATLEYLDALLGVVEEQAGDGQALSQAFLEFLSAIGAGLTAAAKAGLRARLGAQIDLSRAGATQKAWLKLFRPIYESPDHRSLARAMALVGDGEPPGFTVRLPDHAWALRSLARVDDPRGHLSSLGRIRRRRKLPYRSVSTIHKAKGLEFQHVLLCPVDVHQYPSGPLGARLLYVALSRAVSTLELVIDTNSLTPHVVSD